MYEHDGKIRDVARTVVLFAMGREVQKLAVLLARQSGCRIKYDERPIWETVDEQLEWPAERMFILFIYRSG